MSKLQEFAIEVEQEFQKILSCKDQNLAMIRATTLSLSVEVRLQKNEPKLKNHGMFLEDFFCEYKLEQMMAVVESLSMKGGKIKSKKFSDWDKVIFESQQKLRPYHLRSGQWAEIVLKNVKK